jgi:hypothetical protein
MFATTILTRLRTGESRQRVVNFFGPLCAWLAACLPGRRGVTARLRTSVNEVDAMSKGLHEVSARLEEKFLNTTQLLMELDTQGNLFVKRAEKLVNVATGRSGGSEVFFEAMHVVEPPLAFLTDSHLKLKALLDRLRQDSIGITTLIQGREELQRTMAPLKYIQTSFRIESAPLGPEVQAMFTALTQEIEKLHTQVCEIFATKYEELTQIERTIAEVIERLQIQTDEVWKNIAREKVQIDSTLSQLQRELLDNQKRESSIAGLSKELSQDIQKVVTGLQFQDILAQRLQHTIKALAQIPTQFDGSDAGVAMLEQACRIESGQVKSVRADLAGAENSVKNGIHDVIRRITEADEKCVSLKEFEHLTASANGMVQVLLDVLGTLQKQINTTVSGCASAFEILKPIGGTASDLTQVVHELSQRIHLIGLNAQVQAAQVEDGMGLEVLSARTSEISRDTNRISEEMARQLDQLVAGLNESLQQLEKLHTAASAQQKVLLDQGAECEKQLHAMRDDALSALVDIHNLLGNIRQQGEEVAVTATYIEVADASLEELQKKLSAVAAQAAEQVFFRTGGTHSVVSNLKHDYTMASERRVYEAALKGHDADVAASIPAADESMEVELFDAPEPPVTKTAAPSAAPAATSASRAPAPAAIGDNVELF